jgi:hypothetical protein
LLDKDYLSLAEVQVMGVDPLRFAEVGYSRAQSDFGGFNNTPNYTSQQLNKSWYSRCHRVRLRLL